MNGYGVDGCRGGWFFVGFGEKNHEVGVIRRIEELLDRTCDDAPVVIDIPIGLPWSGIRLRACDREARSKPSPHRHSSVFPVPSRAAVYARDYAEANELNRQHLEKGLPKQSWGIVPKIREGFEDRVALLAQHIPNVGDLSSAAFFGDDGLEVERDDILDAMVNAVCAVHIDQALTVGDPSEMDEEGLPMEMVYWPAPGTG